MEKLSFKTHCAIAFGLRMLLIAYATFHDKYFNVPYTDVDYKVFTDAARHILDGKSPFDRHTYRYTPLLALLLTPNIFLHENFGKIVFSFVDIFVALLIRRIVGKQKNGGVMKNICALIWLYNPLTVVISTRGNADSIAVLLVVFTLDALQEDNFIIAGLLHGLSVHFRLYPLAFSLSMYLSLRDGNRFKILPNWNQLKLVFSCVMSVFVLTALSYYFYGHQFLYESFIYHLLRKDARHNFSVYFYMLYLSADEVTGIYQKLLTFLPQLVVLLMLSFCYSDKSTLPFAMFMQAMVMVTYNPVMTSQYFFWFLSLLPLCLSNIKMSKCRSITLVFTWLLAQGLWLIAAYFLEFRGVNSFIFIWLFGLIFFMANVKVITDLIDSYRLLQSAA